jgi:hypothetical protein
MARRAYGRVEKRPEVASLSRNPSRKIIDEVLRLLVGRELLSPEWAERILSRPHTGFNVHSLVRTKTKPEAERVGKYMIRPVLSLDRLSFLEQEGKVGYRWGRDGAEQETEVMDYLEFIARVTSHIPDKGQVMVRYYGLYANAHIYRSSEADVRGGEAPALQSSWLP